jgi:hypothetical protein
MLREWIELLFSPGSRLARRLGLDREAVAIAARHRRRQAAWAPHLEATQGCLLDAAAACPAGGTALILGSGACLDVPVAALAARFATVVLVDAHHPRPAGRLAKSLANVRLIEADVTGLAHTAQRVRWSKAALPRPLPVPVPDLSFGLVPDFTASVNLASQLPLPLAGLLGRRLEAKALADLGREVITAHFEALARLPGRVCLVCDAVWEQVDQGAVLWRHDALEGVVPPTPDRSWTWSIAPRPEESFSYDRQNQVRAWLDFAPAWRRASARP